MIIRGINDLHDHLVIMKEAGLESWFSAIKISRYLFMTFTLRKNFRQLTRSICKRNVKLQKAA